MAVSGTFTCWNSLVRIIGICAKGAACYMSVMLFVGEGTEFFCVSKT